MRSSQCARPNALVHRQALALQSPAVSSINSAMTQPNVAVLAAAGRGQRVHPRRRALPKVMLDVAGKSLLSRNIELVRDELDIDDILIVVGHLGGQIRSALGDGSTLGVRIRYVENDNVDGGLGTLFACIEPHITEPFYLLMGDELYLDTNHRDLLNIESDYTAVCALWECEDPQLLRKNYLAEQVDGLIVSLTEKPVRSETRQLGCGTFAFTPNIFKYARSTPFSAAGKLELIDVIDHAASRGEKVLPFNLTGDYVNVNTVEDLNLARFAVRNAQIDSTRISIVIPCYNEAASIAQVIRDFSPHSDEVIVMDNNSVDGSAEIARSLGATVYSHALAGYGDALKQGMDRASGEILILVEADGTFRSKDLGKFLEFLKDSDMAIGTRTTREMIEQGANMNGLLRWGNVLAGKFIEALWWGHEPRFTDVGCTYRAIWQESYQRIRPHLTRADAAFSPEMMIEMLRANGRVIEIPVSYYGRKGGESKHSGSLAHSILTGLKMLGLILSKRFNLS
jgi:NDP-sugar pyrophosphorylase family protein